MYQLTKDTLAPQFSMAPGTVHLSSDTVGRGLKELRTDNEIYTSEISAKEWDKLSKFAKKDLPKLYFLLNNYKASERDFRICILTRLNFKPKDVAVIAECSLSEVSQARSRLLMKIYGIEGKPSDFDNRIMLMH